MRILIFDISVAGHHLEYIHHLYEYAAQHIKDEFYFILPSSFHKEKQIYDWSDNTNIHIVLIGDDDIEKTNKGGVLKNAYNRTKLLQKYVKEYKADQVFLILLMAFMPFLPFLMPNSVKVSGIIYKIYLYRWNSSSSLKKCFDVFNHLLFAKFKVIKNVFVLNDKSATSYLNRTYHTNKFKYLTDPFNDTGYRGKDIRAEYGITEDEEVYLHFGGLSKRKGTLEILKSLSILDIRQRKNKVFIFAGMPKKEIESDYYKQIDTLKKEGLEIVVINKYCSNQLLNDLCASSDYILCPYKDTDLSSGVLAYAAFYKKTVIGPNRGLIGKLIRRYRLGTLLETSSSESIYETLCNSTISKTDIGQEKYLKLLSISSFCHIIFSNLFENN